MASVPPATPAGTPGPSTAGSAPRASASTRGRLRPKAIRRSSAERRELELQELTKQNAKAADEARLRRALSSRGRRGRGRGFGMGMRGRPANRLAAPLGPFSQAPGSRKCSPSTT